MAIKFCCPGCQHQYEVADELAGRAAKCKKCGGAVSVPVMAASATGIEIPVVTPILSNIDTHRSDNNSGKRPVKSDNTTRQTSTYSMARNTPLVAAVDLPAKHVADLKPTLSQITSAIDGAIEPVKITSKYRFALFLATLVMIALPIIYFALIALAGWGTVWHAINNTGILQAKVRGRGAFLIYVVYLGPIFIGGLLVLFMIKPLFARSPKLERRRSLTRQSDPILYGFVDALCKSVHAPLPKRIDVDCNVNASASFRRGMFSMLGNDLVLTIGMPLVAGLTAKEFAGVLAHEFGHFSQGFGMRMSYVIRSINHWFVRVVYQRDHWDEKLDQMARDFDIRIGIVLHLTRLLVWLTRRILWCLMMLGNIVSGYLLQQMEFDADLHETRFSGANVFASTSRKLPFLGVSYEQALADQREFFLDGRLCDNLPELTCVNRDTQELKLVQEITKSLDEETTSWFATHPCDNDRIAAAMRDGSVGIFKLEAPAKVFFQNYEALCEGTTQDYLHEALGNSYKPEMLVPIERLIGQKTQNREANKALQSILGDAFKVPREIDFAAAKKQLPTEAKQILDTAKDARVQMQSMLLRYKTQCKELDELDTDWMTCSQAITLLDLGAKLEQKDFRVPVKSIAAASEALAQLRVKLGVLSAEMEQFETQFAIRVNAAIRLLQAPKIQSRVDNAAIQLEVARKSIATLNATRQSIIPVAEVRNNLSTFVMLLQAVGGDNVNEKVVGKVMSQSNSINATINRLAEQLHVLDFPFEHAQGNISVAHYLVPKLNRSEDFADVAQAANQMLEQFHSLYFRCLRTLAHTCQLVETALGLPIE